MSAYGKSLNKKKRSYNSQLHICLQLNVDIYIRHSKTALLMTFGKVGGETELWKQLYPSTSKLNMWPPHMNNIFKKKPSFPLTEILLLEEKHTESSKTFP